MAVDCRRVVGLRNVLLECVEGKYERGDMHFGHDRNIGRVLFTVRLTKRTLEWFATPCGIEKVLVVLTGAFAM